MITGIAHTAYKVQDIEASLDFYCGKLGLKEAFRLDRDGQLWLIYLQVSGHTFIELFPGGDKKENLDNRPGAPHLCLQVDDIEKTLAELKSRGLEIAGEARQGADGNKIELMQLMPNSMQVKAVAALEGKG